MAPQRRRRRPRRQEVIEALLEAAGRVFAKRGYDGASVELIAEAAGYSTGAVYSNFKSKEELFLRLYEARTAWRRDELRATMGAAGGGTLGLVAAASSFSETLVTDSDWYLLYLEFVLRAARDPIFAEHFKARRREALRELAAGIADGLEEAGLSSNASARDLARAVRALTHGFAMEHLLEEVSGYEPLPAEVMRLVFRASTGTET